MTTATSQLAFVAGATGFVGREVVRVLCERGFTAVAHVRPESSQRDRWREQFSQLGAQVDCTAWAADDKAAMLERAIAANMAD